MQFYLRRVFSDGDVQYVNDFEKDDFDGALYWAKVYAMSYTADGVDYECETTYVFELSVERNGTDEVIGRFGVEMNIRVVEEEDL